MNAGWLVSTEGCLPTSLGARVRTVPEGRFAETKEVIGGFAIFRANSKERAFKLAHRFLSPVNNGECEPWQLYEPNATQTGQRSCLDLAELAVLGKWRGYSLSALGKLPMPGIPKLLESADCT